MSKIKNILSYIRDLITNACNWMRSDGFLHCFASAIAYLILVRIANPVGSAIITLMLGSFVEAYDEEKGYTSGWHDMMCDCIGVALGVLIYIEYIVF